MVAETLRRLRKNAGLTQADVGELCSVSAVTISRWERGERGIPADKVDALADALGVSAGDIRELREAEDDEPSNGLVNSRLDAYRWLKAIAESDMGVEARAIAAALPLWLNEQSWMVLVTVGQFVERTGLGAELVERHWSEVLDSPFVERANKELEYALWLKFSNS